MYTSHWQEDKKYCDEKTHYDQSLFSPDNDGMYQDQLILHHTSTVKIFFTKNDFRFLCKFLIINVWIDLHASFVAT